MRSGSASDLQRDRPPVRADCIASQTRESAERDALLIGAAPASPDRGQSFSLNRPSSTFGLLARTVHLVGSPRTLHFFHEPELATRPAIPSDRRDPLRHEGRSPP